MIANYDAPRIVQSLVLEHESPLLNGSGTNALNAGVDTKGQDVNTFDFTHDNSFKHEWQ